MKTVNSVTLIGYVYGELQTKELDNGTSVTTCLIKTRDTHKGKSSSNYHLVAFWNSIGDNASGILKKDDVVYIRGRLKTKKFVDKNGSSSHKTEIVAEEYTKIRESDLSEYSDES